MEQLKKDLKNPPKQYRPIPFWSWNEKLDTEETAWQIAQMDAAGIGGYFMHARGGLQTPYMGEEWMDNIRCGIKEGEARGMGAWGYDENGWPSGFGGGIVNGLGADYQQKYLRYQLLEEEKNDAFTLINLPYEGKFLHFYYDVNPFYVDTLDANVIQVFLKTIHDRYEKELGDDFKSMAGFFTDEPQISRNGIPWSFVLPARFFEATGKELLPLLPALFFETEGHEAVRYAFWKLVRDLFTDAYMKQVYDWCEAHKVRLTGHMVLEETMEAQLVSNSACMPSYEYMHIPGMDWLGRLVGQTLTPVQVASVAHQLGKKQVLSETFALCGWDVSFEELKWIYEWQMVRGINLLCPHLEGYSLRGIRKRDYPATLFYQQPWWEDYRELLDVFSRIGMVLTEGEARFEMLVIHPMSSAWCCFNNGENGLLRDLDTKLETLLNTLETSQIQYDLGDERILERHGAVKDGKLTVGKQSYRAVILPDAINLSAHTVALLEEFAKSGGLLLFSPMIPSMIDGVPSDRMQVLADCGRRCVSPEEIAASLPADLRPVQIAGNGTINGLASTVRSFADGEKAVYLVNSAKERRQFTVSFAGEGAKQLDYRTGEIIPIRHRAENGMVSVDLDLAGMGSVLLFSAKGAAAAPVSQPLSPINRKLGKDWQIVSADPNALTLDFCDCYFDDALYQAHCPVNNIQEAACALGRKVKIDLLFTFDVAKKPAAPLYLALETPEKFSVTVNGIPISGDCGYYWDKSFRKLPITDAVREGENTIALSIDFVQSDHVYRAIQNALQFESEKNMLSYDNEIEAIYLVGDFSLLTPGSFTEMENNALRYDGTFLITEPAETLCGGDIARQGYPFYSGRMVLKNTVTLGPEELAHRSLRFAERCSTVTKVRVNGVPAGSVLWQPYEVPLEGLLREGENVIEVEIVDSLRNLLGPHHLKEGECHMVAPGSFFETSPIWAGGKNKGWDDRYHFVRHGLKLE